MYVLILACDYSFNIYWYKLKLLFSHWTPSTQINRGRYQYFYNIFAGIYFIVYWAVDYISMGNALTFLWIPLFSITMSFSLLFYFFFVLILLHLQKHHTLYPICKKKDINKIHNIYIRADLQGYSYCCSEIGGLIFLTLNSEVYHIPSIWHNVVGQRMHGHHQQKVEFVFLGQQ